MLTPKTRVLSHFLASVWAILVCFAFSISGGRSDRHSHMLRYMHSITISNTQVLILKYSLSMNSTARARQFPHANMVQLTVVQFIHIQKLIQ